MEIILLMFVLYAVVFDNFSRLTRQRRPNFAKLVILPLNHKNVYHDRPNIFQRLKYEYQLAAQYNSYPQSAEFWSSERQVIYQLAAN